MSPDLHGVRAVLTDIEGTTSSIRFVKDVLFPYARERMAPFIARHGHEPAVREALEAVRETAGSDLGDAEVAAVLERWIDEDRKATPLKALQGMIWRAGYEQGDYQAHVYADAVRRLRDWHARGVPVHVYSSGSVQAQRLFFVHTEAGDLSPLLAGHFDTTTGPKQEAASYEAIARALGLAPAAVLFLSDVVAELDAARAAGMVTRLVVRGDDGPDPAGHPVIHSFDELDGP